MDASRTRVLEQLRAAGIPVADELPSDARLHGFAASIEPRGGDPDLLCVWTKGSLVWHIDRRSARIVGAGDGPVDADLASRAADLADRAQLTLGRPVELRWVLGEREPEILAVSDAAFVPRFTTEPYHRVSLLEADDGAVAPLSIEALGKAMRDPGDTAFDASVRRLYARPYRRVVTADEPLASPFALDASTLGPKLERLLKDLALPLFDAERFDRKMSSRLAALDARALSRLDLPSLLAHLRDCERVCIESLELLDRIRHATGAIEPLLDALTGASSRDELEALAAPRVSVERRRIVERMQRLAARLVTINGSIPPYRNLAPAHRTAWEAARTLVRDERDLGLDAKPDAWGESDETFHAALVRLRALDLDAPERARRDAQARLVAKTRHLPLAFVRDVAVRSICAFVSRAATTKGEVADALSRSLLRLKRAALHVGSRLVERSILDAPEDALFLGVSELHDAASGEPGAYASRVRLRREDDARWCAFVAPEKLLPVD